MSQVEPASWRPCRSSPTCVMHASPSTTHVEEEDHVSRDEPGSVPPLVAPATVLRFPL